jgi:hypothetical protein
MLQNARLPAAFLTRSLSRSIRIRRFAALSTVSIVSKHTGETLSMQGQARCWIAQGFNAASSGFGLEPISTICTWTW